MGHLYKYDRNKCLDNNCASQRQEMAPRHNGEQDIKTIDQSRTWIKNKIKYQSLVEERKYYYCRYARDMRPNENRLDTLRSAECDDRNKCSEFMCSTCDQVICGGCQRGSAASIKRFAPRIGRIAMLNKYSWFSMMLVFVCVFLVSLKDVQCARGSVTPEYIDDDVQNYLTQFGYLPQSSFETGNLRSEDQLRDAIKNLQRFGHVPATGKIDEETKKLLKKPRCGLPDYSGPERRRRRFTQQGNVWNHTDLTWSLQKKPQNLDMHKVRAELARALAVWSDHSKLTFTEINSDKADIVVSFVRRFHDDNYPFDGRGQILAHAFFPGSGRGGDAHFDDDEIWLLSDASEDEEGTSLFAVAAHEFGHSLGLSHSSVHGALMYPWYQGIKPNFELPEDDRLGIQKMYGSKEERMWAKIPDYATQSPPEPATERPRWPSQHPGSNPEYPRYRPRYPHTPERTPDEKRPESPRRPETPEREPERPNPRPVPENPPPRVPHHTTPRPRYPDRKRNEYPDRRNGDYPDRRNNDYPDRRHNYPDARKPQYPHHPHTTTPRTYYPRTTTTPYHKPEYPKKHHPKKPYHPPEKPWKEDREPERKPTDDSPKPDSCNTNYDAIALIRGEVFIFKSKYLWRIGDKGVMNGFPTFTNRMWGGLPTDMTHVDAVYERPDGKIVFFIGKQYYVFNGNQLEWGYPRPLTDLGLPSTLEHLNAAMVWGHNGKTYFYNETMYWKYDEDVGKVELDYPRDMSMWKGVGNNVDAVFQWKDGKTYFFKGKGFWKFNDLHMRVEHEKQRPSGPFWMGCPYEEDEDLSTGNKQPYQGLPPSPTSTFDFSNGSSRNKINIFILLVISTFYIIKLDLT